MAEKSLIEAASGYIEGKLLQTKRKFELVYSSTNDAVKKDQMMNGANQVERDLKKLRAGLFGADDLARYSIQIEDLQNNRTDQLRKDLSDYKILRNIPTVKLNQFSTNLEINTIWSYLLFFETEYLGLLSEQNLKLDYGHAYQRDQFFTTFNETVRFLQRYGDLLEQIDSAGNKDYKERLVSIQSKQYRDVIIRTGKFLNSVEEFIEDILNADKKDERVLLEPDREVTISGDGSSLNGVTAIAAIHDLKDFIEEFIDFIKIPEIKKIEDEE